MRCSEAKFLLDRRLTDDLKDDETSELAEHLAACETCTQQDEAFRGLLDQIAELPVVPAPEGFAASVMRNLGTFSKWWLALRAQVMPRLRLPARNTMAFATVGVFALGVLFFYPVPTPPPPDPDAAVVTPTVLAFVELFEGPLEVRKADEDEWKPAQKGRLLSPGESVRLATTTATATLVWMDNSEVDLTHGAEYQVLSQNRSRLETGIAVFRVTTGTGQGFEVLTPQGRVGVLGTHFSLQIHEVVTQVEVYEGRVWVQGGSQRRVLKAGDRVLVSEEDLTDLNAPDPEESAPPPEETTASAAAEPTTASTAEATDEEAEPDAMPAPVAVSEPEGVPSPAEEDLDAAQEAARTLSGESEGLSGTPLEAPPGSSLDRFMDSNGPPPEPPDTQ